MRLLWRRITWYCIWTHRKSLRNYQNTLKVGESKFGIMPFYQILGNKMPSRSQIHLSSTRARISWLSESSSGDASYCNWQLKSHFYNLLVFLISLFWDCCFYNCGNDFIVLRLLLNFSGTSNMSCFQRQPFRSVTSLHFSLCGVICPPNIVCSRPLN